MKENVALVLGWIGLSEGGYVNNPRDPGGATDRGITQRTYDGWNRSHGRPPKPVRGISKDEADAIIKRAYLDKVEFDLLPAGVDYSVADYAVNSGVSRAAKALQAVLGVAQDGDIGPQTLGVLAGRDPVKVIEALNAERLAFMKRARHPETGALLWKTFGGGWQTRVYGRKAGIQSGDIGVADRSVQMALGVQKIPPPTVPVPGKATEPVKPVINPLAAFFTMLARIFGRKA